MGPSYDAAGLSSPKLTQHEASLNGFPEPCLVGQNDT